MDEMCHLLSAMLTSRPFDEVIERSRSGSFETAAAASSPDGGGDKSVIRGYAQRYLRDIIEMSRRRPPTDAPDLQDERLPPPPRHGPGVSGQPRYASRRVLKGVVGAAGGRRGGRLTKLRSWISYLNVVARIEAYKLWTRLARARRLRLG